MKHLLAATFLMFSVSGFADTSADPKLKNYYKNLKITAECAYTMSINSKINGGYDMQRHQFVQLQGVSRSSLGKYLVKNGSDYKEALIKVNEFNNEILKQSKLEWDNGDEVEQHTLVDQCVRLYNYINKNK